MKMPDPKQEHQEQSVAKKTLDGVNIAYGTAISGIAAVGKEVPKAMKRGGGFLGLVNVAYHFLEYVEQNQPPKGEPITIADLARNYRNLKITPSPYSHPYAAEISEEIIRLDEIETYGAPRTRISFTDKLAHHERIPASERIIGYAIPLPQVQGTHVNVKSPQVVTSPIQKTTTPNPEIKPQQKLKEKPKKQIRVLRYL
jgi:hypothetical protein